MSSKSKRRNRRNVKEEQPQLDDQEVEELKAQADEAVQLLAHVREQFPAIVDVIPRGQLVEYLRHGSRRTYARYFKGFRPERIPRARLIGFLAEEIFTNDNGVLAHLLIVLWNDQKRELYEAAKDRLQEINPNIEEIDRIEADFSRAVIADLIERFGKQDVAILTMINDARFDREVLAELLPEWTWPPLKDKERTEAEEEKLAEMKAAKAGEEASAEAPAESPEA